METPLSDLIAAVGRVGLAVQALIDCGIAPDGSVTVDQAKFTALLASTTELVQAAEAAAGEDAKRRVAEDPGYAGLMSWREQVRTTVEWEAELLEMVKPFGDVESLDDIEELLDPEQRDRFRLLRDLTGR